MVRFGLQYLLFFPPCFDDLENSGLCVRMSYFEPNQCGRGQNMPCTTVVHDMPLFIPWKPACDRRSIGDRSCEKTANMHWSRSPFSFLCKNMDILSNFSPRLLPTWVTLLCTTVAMVIVARGLIYRLSCSMYIGLSVFGYPSPILPP